MSETFVVPDNLTGNNDNLATMAMMNVQSNIANVGRILF